MPVHFDELGLITEKDGNGGDSANRMGLWLVISFCLAYILGDKYKEEFRLNQKIFLDALKLLEPHPYVFIRHPGEAKDKDKADSRDFAQWNNWNVMSRDNWLPLVSGIALVNPKKFKYIFNTTLKRHGTMPNGDILGPGHWAHLTRMRYILAKMPKMSYLILILGDLWNMMGFLLGLLKPLNKTSDTLNGFMMLVISNVLRGTLISRCNLYIVKKFGRYPKRWSIYFGHKNGCRLHEHAEPLFKVIL